MRWIIIYDSSFLPIRYNFKRNSFTAISVISLKPFPIPASVSCSVHASNVLRHAERMHALSSCVWNGEEKKGGKKKLRRIDVDYELDYELDYWPNGCVDLVNSRTSIRYALENSSCAIILLHSFISRLRIPRSIILLSFKFFKKRNKIIACISCKIISITIQFEVTS